MTAKREYGLDLLRIISMMGIVATHILIAGDGRGPMYTASPAGVLLQALTFLSICSVDLFAMLSGYLYAPKPRARFGNLIGLLVNLEAYCVLFTVVLYFLSSSFLVDASSVLASLFPMTVGAYWYLTAYICVFLLIPWLNKLIQSMTRRQHAALLGTLFCLFCLVPTLTGTDYFVIQDGYSPFWLIFCYLLGSYIRLYREEVTRKVPQRWYPLFLLGNILAAMACYALVMYGYLPETVFERISTFNSPLCIGNAVILMLMFLDIRITGNRWQQILQTLSGAAFDVYVIHCHNYFYDIFIRGNFDFLAEQTPVAAVLLLSGILIVFYLACTIAYLCRKQIFRLLPIDRFVKWAGDGLDRLQERNWA